jgi:hypothetical protein
MNSLWDNNIAEKDNNIEKLAKRGGNVRRETDLLHHHLILKGGVV